MTTERSPVMSGTTKSDQEALNRIFESEKKRRDAEAVETAKALEGWREKYKTERARVVGPNLQAWLDSYAREHQRQSLQDGGTSDPAREGDARKVRLDSFHFAHDLGLNWAGLAELNEAASRKLRGIVTPRRKTLILEAV